MGLFASTKLVPDIHELLQRDNAHGGIKCVEHQRVGAAFKLPHLNNVFVDPEECALKLASLPPLCCLATPVQDDDLLLGQWFGCGVDPVKAKLCFRSLLLDDNIAYALDQAVVDV